MRLTLTRRLTAGTLAFGIGLTLFGVGYAQDAPPPGGIITGEVARCVNGAETPAGSVAVGIAEGGSRLAFTAADGSFFLALPAGQYTVIAMSDDGTSAMRAYVPVEVGALLDIGILDLGTGLSGCGPDAPASALPGVPLSPPLPDQQQQPAPTPTPGPLGTPTPVPAPPAPDAPAAPDQPAPPAN